MRIEANHLSFGYRNGIVRERVLEDISFSIGEGETVGILGKSGCGKSTLGYLISGLKRPDAGEILYQGSPLGYPVRQPVRRQIQVLYQHPENSFNPRLEIYSSLREIYTLYRIPFSDKALQDMLEPFGIYPEHLHRLPAQLSGGELQRIALARVLLARPRLMVLDEPTSMLDSISQAQMIRMLMALQKDTGISYLFITHNPLLCEFASHRIFVLKDKKLEKLR